LKCLLEKLVLSWRENAVGDVAVRISQQIVRPMSAIFQFHGYHTNTVSSLMYQKYNNDQK